MEDDSNEENEVNEETYREGGGKKRISAFTST